MGKIFKNMLPYWKWILVIVAFLVMQAFCDLSLPQYTSDIIDVGIMSSGVEHILPEEMTQEDFVSTQLFMTSREKKTFAACYKEPKKDGNYVRNCEEDTLDDMDESLLEPIVMVYQMSQMKESDIDEKAITAKMGTDGTQVDMKQLMQALAAGQVPDQQILEMRKQVSGQIDAIGSSTLKSMGVTYAISCDKNAGVDVDAIQKHYLWTTGAKMLGFALLMVMAAVVVGYCASRVGASIGRDLRDKTFRNVVQYSNAEMDHFSTASLITRSTNDVQQIQMTCVILLRMVAYAPILGIGGIIHVAQAGSSLTWIIVLAVALLLALITVLMQFAMPKFRIMQKLVDRLNLVSREILTGIMPIRAFSREQHEEARFDAANTDLMRTQLFTNRVMAAMMPFMTLIMNGTSLLIVWFGGKQIDAGTMQVGSMIAFITYTMQIVMSFLMLTMVAVMLPRAGVAADRIDEVLTTEPAIHDPVPEAIPADLNQHHWNGEVAFHHVNFTYPGSSEDALHDIDFVAKPGQTTAIIGSTGCGKTSLLHLITRFYDVTGGSVTVDGVDAPNSSIFELSAHVGTVLQDPDGQFIGLTVGEDIAFALENSCTPQDEMHEITRRAAGLVGIENHLDYAPHELSGGQKQRVSLAGVMVDEVKILLFDEPLANLDPATGKVCQRLIEQ